MPYTDKIGFIKGDAKVLIIWILRTFLCKKIKTCPLPSPAMDVFTYSP